MSGARPTDALPRLIAIVGTTASGKSDLGIQLALRLGGEVVGADSRQVYRGLDIGTGKVSAAERALVPHHLLDVADVRERFTVAAYQPLALAAIRGIADRGRVPLLVGGSGLYIRAVLDNPIFPAGPSSAALRAELEATPLPSLVERLRTLDPGAAATVDLNNPRRVVRAVEVTLVSGQPFSGQRRTGEPLVQALQIGLTWPRAILRERIADRLRARLDASPGLVDEVRGLLAAGVPPERLLELGLEYRYVTRYLQGQLTSAELFDQLVNAIARFAKRQLTWFRADTRIHWLEDPTDPLPEAERLARDYLAPLQSFPPSPASQ